MILVLAKTYAPFAEVRAADVTASSVRGPNGERQSSGIIHDLIEQLPNRLSILGAHRQLIAEGIGRRVKRGRILRASTP
jgi:hypothetical protein